MKNNKIKWITLNFVISKVIIYSAIIFICAVFLNKSFSDIMLNYDGTHYYEIAIKGYKNLQYAFFPALPLIISLFNILGIPIWGTIIFNLIFNYMSIILIYKINTEIYNDSWEYVKYKLYFFIYCPIALFTSILYTESLFIFLTLTCYYLYKKDKYLIVCGISMGLAVFTRNVGCLLYFIIFVFMFIKMIKNQKDRIKEFIKILKIYIPATIISCIYPAYLYFIKGNPFYFVTVQYLYWQKKKGCFITMIIQDINILTNSKSLTLIVSIINAVVLAIILYFYFKVIFTEIRKMVMNKKCSCKIDMLIYAIIYFVMVTSAPKFSPDGLSSLSVYRYILASIPIYILPDGEYLNKFESTLLISLTIFLTILYTISIFVA